MEAVLAAASHTHIPAPMASSMSHSVAATGRAKTHQTSKEDPCLKGKHQGPCTEWSPTPSSPYTESETAPGKQVTAPMPTLRHCRVVGLITRAPDANSPCGMALSV